MATVNDAALLKKFVQYGSQDAFRELVNRHASLVFSVCRRQIGDQDLAEDASQAVFLLLAQKASKIKVQDSLAGWLYTAARLVSRDAVKKERKRMKRETQLDESCSSSEPTVSLVSPHVDEALARLRERDREAIILRYFECMSLAEVGLSLGTSEDAARMRIDRALERMRKHLASSGVSAAALQTALPAMVHEAPGRLLHSLNTFNPVTPTVPHAIQAMAKGGSHLMFSYTKVLAAGALVAGLATTGYVFSARSHLRTLSRDKGALASLPYPGKEVTIEPPTIALGTLNQPFTLTYHLEHKDMRTEQFRQQMEEEARRLLEKPGTHWIPPAREEDNITLSYDGETLLYIKDPVSANSDDTTRNIVLISHGRSFSYIDHLTKPGVSYGQLLNMRVSVWGMEPMLLIGASLPYLPLLNGNKVLSIEGSTDHVPYIDSKISTAKSDSGSTVLSKLGFGKYQTVSFDDYRDFQGVPIAGLVSIIDDYMPRHGEKGRIPGWDDQYTLTNAKTTPLPPNSFKMESYLKDHDVVQINMLPMGSKGLFVDFSSGTLEQQIERTISDPRQGWSRLSPK